MQLTNDLNKFPKGIETYIDLDKDNLSGGQKQKVVLVRYLNHEDSIKGLAKQYNIDWTLIHRWIDKVKC